MSTAEKEIHIEPHPRRKQVIAVLAWLAFGVFLFLALRDFYYGGVLMNNPPSLASKRFVFFLLSLPVWIGLYGYGLWAAWSGKRPARTAAALERIRAALPGWLRLLLGAVILALPALLFLYSPVGQWPVGYWSRLAAVLGSALLALLLVEPRPFAEQGLRYMLLVLAAGALFTACGWLNRVTDYPFSMSWSEGNRIYDYSMLFASDRYDTPEGKPVHTFISLGRQFLWALPFLIPGAGIFLIRLWDALLWILPPMLLGWALVKGLPVGKRAWIWQAAFVLWAFIFMAQGPIYAPLVVAALLVVIGVRLRWLAAGLVLVMLAGYYAQISRWTWAYAPGLWAGMLALLQVNAPTLRPAGWKKLLRPVAFGLAGYFGGQIMPRLVTWISNGFSQPLKVQVIVDPTTSIAHHPLLWDRLLPNPTYPPGLFLGTLWAGLALCVLLVYLWKRGLWQMNTLQGLAAAVISLVFLGVGIVISVKIGGGSNLHNLDMFWLTVVLLAGWALHDLARSRPSLTQLSALPVVSLLLALSLLGPVTYNVQYGSPLVLPAQPLVDDALTNIQKAVLAAQQKGEVLFIDQRQMLAFGDVARVPLVAAYEKKVLMDQAMADNARYFEQFNKDIAAKRFVLIVTEPIRVSYINTDERVFAEENNSWVKWVSEPLLTYYQPSDTFQEVGVQLLVPKP